MWASIGRNPLVWILLAAFVIRAAAGGVLQFQLDNVLNRRFLMEGDANGYWVLGKQILTGQPYEIYTPPRRVLRMPGFPLFLAAAMKLADVVGQSNRAYLAARLMLAAVGTLACGLVFLLGRELFDRRTGLIAAALCAFSPAMAGFSVVLLSETLFAAALLASLVLMARLVRTGLDNGRLSRGACLSAASGVAIALACYVRPTWLLVGPLFALVLVVLASNRTRAACFGGLVVVALFAALLPWAFRNDHVTGHRVFTTLWVGPSLYDGLHPGATGESDMAFFETDGLLGKMPEYDVDRHYRSQAWQFVVDQPLRALWLSAVKLWRFWKPWPNAAQFQNTWVLAAVLMFFVPVLVLAAAGWWSCRENVWGWLLTVGPILYFSAVHMVFIGSLRYRLPVEYPLCVMSAVGLQNCLRSTMIGGFARKRDEG